MVQLLALQLLWELLVAIHGLLVANQGLLMANQGLLVMGGSS